MTFSMSLEDKIFLEAKLLYSIAHFVAHSLRHTIFLNNFKINKDRHFKLGTLDLNIVSVILTKRI